MLWPKTENYSMTKALTVTQNRILTIFLASCSIFKCHLDGPNKSNTGLQPQESNYKECFAESAFFFGSSCMYTAALAHQ